jgi:hypothetical protein
MPSSLKRARDWLQWIFDFPKDGLLLPTFSSTSISDKQSLPDPNQTSTKSILSCCRTESRGSSKCSKGRRGRCWCPKAVGVAVEVKAEIEDDALKADAAAVGVPNKLEVGGVAFIHLVNLK